MTSLFSSAVLSPPQTGGETENLQRKMCESERVCACVLEVAPGATGENDTQVDRVNSLEGLN